MPQRRNEQTTQNRSEPFAYIAEYDGDGNVEFEAWADPGTETTDEKWICAKHTYSSLNLTKTQWAKDSSNITAGFTNAANALSGLDYV